MEGSRWGIGRKNDRRMKNGRQQEEKGGRMAGVTVGGRKPFIILNAASWSVVKRERQQHPILKWTAWR
jgi:hypothetical protein